MLPCCMRSAIQLSSCFVLCSLLHVLSTQYLPPAPRKPEAFTSIGDTSHISGDVGFYPRPCGLRATGSRQWSRESQELLARGWKETQQEQDLAARSQQGGAEPLPGKGVKIRNDMEDREARRLRLLAGRVLTTSLCMEVGHGGFSFAQASPFCLH